MDFRDTIISIYKDAGKPKPTGSGSIMWALDVVKSGFYKVEVAEIRAEKTKEGRDALKKKINAVTFSGHFKYRNSDEKNLIKYSGFLCHDIDKLNEEELMNLKSKLSNDPYVFACFISPSGNGVKVLFRTKNEDYNKHKDYWCAVEKYINKTYNQECDELPKNHASLCFLSHDEKLYLNEDAIVIDKAFVDHWIDETALPKNEKSKLPTKSNTDLEQRFLSLAHETAVKTHPNVPGSYNAYINTFALFCCRYGLNEATTANAVADNCGWGAPDKEDIATIRSVYQKFSGEFGMWAEDFKQGNGQQGSGSGTAKKTSSAPTTAKPGKQLALINEKGFDDEVKFWFKTDKLNAKGEVVVDKNTGEVKVDYQLSYDNAMTFLQNNGFFKLYEGESYRLIRLDVPNSQVDIVLDIRLEEFMLDYLKSQRNEEFNRVREIFRRSVTKFCNPRQFAGLDYYSPKMRKDSANNAYVYFNNCYFEITKEGPKQCSYHNMDGFIWKKQVINHDYTAVDFQACDFQLFILLAITGKRSLDELDEVERKKYDATITGIGYLLHKFKDPSVAKAVLGVDKKTRGNNDEMNGGSGKSIIGRAIGKMLNMFLIDGQNFRFDDQFAFDGVSPDTQFINFNDVNGGFNFQRMFGMITEDFTYRGLYAKRVSVAYEDSPKFYISTNHTLRGGGESVLRRQHIIEFTDYFNARHTPFKEFKRMLFSGWDNTEWSRFYSFFMHCIATFLQVGLVDFPIENYELRKLLEWNSGMGAELNDYLNETILEQLQYNSQFDQTKLHEGIYQTLSLPKDKIKANTITSQIKLWAKLNKLDINAHLNGERDRRNNITYLTFTAYPNEDGTDVFDKAIQEQNNNEKRLDVI